MTKIFSLLPLIFLLVSQLIAQPCQEITIATDSTKQSILRQFISSAEKNRFFVNDKGIVKLTRYQDANGLTRWYLVATIDDQYKDNPPTKFSDFDGDIVLVYDADSSGKELPTKGNAANINQCLEEKIGDRVYIRPRTKNRWTSHEYKTLSGKIIRQGQRRITTGNGGSLIIIFQKDGTYKTLTPV